MAAPMGDPPVPTVEARSVRKRVSLFLLVFVLPCLVLAALSVRMVRQDRELAQKRAADERRRWAGEIGQSLFNRLEILKRQHALLAPGAAERASPEVILTGVVDGRTLLLPWDAASSDSSGRLSLAQDGFVRQINRAERQEFVVSSPSGAARLYRRILETSLTPSQAAYVRLLLARTLVKSDQGEEARDHYLAILALPSALTDEYGVPFFLYAAGRLIDLTLGVGEITRRIREELDSSTRTPPSGMPLLRDLCERVSTLAAGSALEREAVENRTLVTERSARLERVLALQTDFPGFYPNLRTEADQPVWVAVGKDGWLASLVAAAADAPTGAIVVDGRAVFGALREEGLLSALPPGTVELVLDGTGRGEYAGPGFRGLRLAFAGGTATPAGEGRNLQSTIFYTLTLFVVIGVTTFGAYLLWRDVRRDLQTAELRSQFVSSVSHDLKTPLTSIQMFAETLRLGRAKDAATKDEYLETIVEESHRLTRLLNNVLDFSKVEKGLRTFRLERGSLEELVRESARTMGYQLQQLGFTLRVRVEPGVPAVRMDRDALEQAVLSLLDNAMKYSGDSRDITLTLERDGIQAAIRVTDRGVGIHPREHRLIFEKFYRAAPGEHARTTGTGLGLSLAAHTVAAHGGRIDVDSAPGAGSTFSIMLPLEDES